MPDAPGASRTDPLLSGGGGLTEMGIGSLRSTNLGAEMGAYSESERQMYNARVRSQNVLGVQKLGAMAGTVAGMSIGGPLGGALGGMAGGMVGGVL